MSVQILENEDGLKAFYCTTTDTAFGPVISEDLQLYEFLSWFPEDVRAYDTDGIMRAINKWKEATTKCRTCAKANKSCPIWKPNKYVDYCVVFALDIEQVELGSIVMEGLDKEDYPDFVDAYPVKATFTDGEELDDDLLYELSKNDDLMQETALKQYLENAENEADQKAEYLYQCRKDDSLC